MRKLALELAQDPNRFLPTVQFGITLVSTFVAVFGGEELVNAAGRSIAKNPRFDFIAHHAHAIALGILVVGITFLSLLLGELVPKQLALRQAETLARIGGADAELDFDRRPAVCLVHGPCQRCRVVFAALRRNQSEPSVSVDDIEHMIETGTQEGVLESVEQRVAVEALAVGRANRCAT